MKRIFAIALTLITVLAALTGCMSPQKSSGDEGEQNPSGKRLPIVMTIAETLPSCVAFEYKDEKPYCFYAFDSDGKLYRVLWTDWNDLNENDKIVVEYSDIKMITYPEPTTGWNPQYEITALCVRVEESAIKLPDLSESITFSSGDVLSQKALSDDDKQIILNILGNDKEWISDIPECAWICRFSGSVNVGYCDCGTLSDIGNNRSRKLTDAEKENIESLISQLNEEPTHSGYEVEVELFQYTWDGWGISTKTVGACDVAYNIIDALKAMKETGETVPKISDEVFEIGGGQYAAERGTMWIESGNKIYRLTPDLSQICLVETHFGEGKVLEITDAFKTNVNNAWHYAPYDYYKGTYNKGDYTVNLTSVFKSGSTVQLSIKKIQIESGYDPTNTITVELISSVDQEVNIKLHCQQSGDNLAAGDYKTVQLKKGEPTTVDLTFGGWPNFTYWVYIEADFTKAEITINP